MWKWQDQKLKGKRLAEYTRSIVSGWLRFLLIQKVSWKAELLFYMASKIDKKSDAHNHLTECWAEICNMMMNG